MYDNSISFRRLFYKYLKLHEDRRHPIHHLIALGVQFHLMPDTVIGMENNLLLVSISVSLLVRFRLLSNFRKLWRVGGLLSCARTLLVP